MEETKSYTTQRKTLSLRQKKMHNYFNKPTNKIAPWIVNPHAVSKGTLPQKLPLYYIPSTLW